MSGGFLNSIAHPNGVVGRFTDNFRVRQQLRVNVIGTLEHRGGDTRFYVILKGGVRITDNGNRLTRLVYGNGSFFVCVCWVLFKVGTPVGIFLFFSTLVCGVFLVTYTGRGNIISI